MLTSIYDIFIVSVLVTHGFAAPAPASNQQRNARPAQPKARDQLKPRQNSPAINAANNVWPQASGGPIVLDLPNGPVRSTWPHTLSYRSLCANAMLVKGATGPPSASGQPYPTTNLAGFNGAPVSGDASVPSPTLIPAQSADAKEGLILDFENLDAPQPIRGTAGKSGGTDDEALGKCYYCVM